MESCRPDVYTRGALFWGVMISTELFYFLRVCVRLGEVHCFLRKQRKQINVGSTDTVTAIERTEE